jgi:outer membrane protease
MKYLEFEDKPRFGLYFRLGFEWVYGLTDRLDVAGEFRYGKSVKAKGDTRISSTGYVRKREIVRDGGGAVFDETGVTLMIRIKL